jgi:predicted nucleotidyltransferase
MTDPIAMLRAVAVRLADLREQVVFVGGTSIALLLTDVAGHHPRSTDDVDAISEVRTRLELAEFETHLRRLGFKPDLNRATCSWLIDGMMIDVMPMNGELLGLTSLWFPEAAQHSQVVDLDGISIRVATAPYLLATKLDAFADRGSRDPVASVDLEDIISLIDGREELVQEVTVAAPNLRRYLKAAVGRLLNLPDFAFVVSAHLRGDSGSQSRLGIVLDRLSRLAGHKTPK